MNKYNFFIDVANMFNLKVVISAETQEKANYIFQRALSNIKVITNIEEGVSVTCEFKENLSNFRNCFVVEQFFTKKAIKINSLDGRYSLIDSSVENKKVNIF